MMTKRPRSYEALRMVYLEWMKTKCYHDRATIRIRTVTKLVSYEMRFPKHFTNFPCLGDMRGTAFFTLGVLQSMYHRFHNIVAEQLKSLHPKWNDEKLYQETRRIVIAVYQNHVMDWLRVFSGTVLEFYPVADWKFINFQAKKKRESFVPTITSIWEDTIQTLIPVRQLNSVIPFSEFIIPI